MTDGNWTVRETLTSRTPRRLRRSGPAKNSIERGSNSSKRPPRSQIGDSLGYNVCHCRTETVVPHSEGVPAYREPSLRDGKSWPLHSCRRKPNQLPLPVFSSENGSPVPPPTPSPKNQQITYIGTMVSGPERASAVWGNRSRPPARRACSARPCLGISSLCGRS